ncbi:MAG: CYTH domain-containing protein [Polyangiaceae bacterium]|nr:CYTH domain-containing protein [Polyangiaceae bacterium]
MAHLEIEKKFLVKRTRWQKQVTPSRLRQGYIDTNGPATVRVRIHPGGALLTLKGPERSFARTEFEYPIPASDAQLILETLCAGRVVDKLRYRVLHRGFAWEVDEFLGHNAGLVVAEVEAESVEHLAEAVAHRPPWVGDEVSDDRRFRNSQLARRPFLDWPDDERREIERRLDEQ